MSIGTIVICPDGRTGPIVGTFHARGLDWVKVETRPGNLIAPTTLWATIEVTAI